MNLLEKQHGRAALFAVLYASEGGPIGFIWWALPALLRSRGVPVTQITALTALLVLPWVLKFLWAPLVDALRGPRWGLRAWIIVAQLLMGAALLPLIWLDPLAHFGWWRALLLAHAVAAATQDVAVDALAINTVETHERGALNGYMQAGMLLGRSLFGGGALLLVGKLGWPWIFAGLLGCIWLSLLLLLFVREPVTVSATRHGLAHFAAHLRRAFSLRRTWLGLAFALTSAAAFEAAGALAGPYLIDRQVSSATIGFFFAVPVVAAMVLGGVLGGNLSDRWGRAKAVGLFLIGFVALVAALGLLEQAGLASARVALALLTALYFFIGLFTAASYALFMDLTDPRAGGTQFSTFMAATNACEAWAGWTGGQLAARAGYGIGFLLMSAASLLSLPFLRGLGVAKNNEEEEEERWKEFA